MPIDYKKYPPTWKTEIVPAILKRACNRCEWCGLQNYSIISREDGHAEVYGYDDDYKSAVEQLHVICPVYPRKKKFSVVVLTVAHLDHDPENWDVDLKRLMAMCQKCHLTYDRLHREGLKIKENPPLPFNQTEEVK